MKRYRVEPGSKVDLSRIDAGDTSAFAGGKSDTKEVFAKLNDRLEELQEMLWAEGRHKVLVVLQGMDTSGKDGTIRHVLDGVNPLGVRVASFKAPTPEELAHDFLWRVHPKVPASGEMVIFNRSHYEDVLAVRVKELAPPKVWKPRYDQINDFERLLSQSGTTILKFFLHIDKDEQKERLQARLDDPTKRWKFRKGDLVDRKLWKKFTEAYEEALSRTSKDDAPWYVVPANKKWYRNLVVATILVETLEKLDMRYPDPEEDLDGIEID
ncbi:MAG TPA: polyphosphate kinase 2 family protein [Thermoanaerobaculia bacterium]|jgi:PPK2 family polyphosphate:nucleotide phosphotransferase|nr:polyphosphate kinase 2 family protein [Thermoanaerobaculia bacterium]